MKVSEAFAAMKQAMEDGRGEQDLVIAIRVGEDRWLEAKMDGVAYEDRGMATRIPENVGEPNYTAVTGEMRRVSYYSRGHKESESWRTWEDEL